MKMIAAGGFKDITRISSSSPTMWEHICMTNKDNILALLDDYMASLSAIRSEIEAQKSDEIHDFFDSARTYRDSFPETSSGPIKKAHVFYVEIPDENGALATIVTLLAFAQISIKNISITHNREVAQGSLRMELYEEKDLPRAMQILQEKNYQVFQS
jgi:prephenate dehydrogenase